MSSSKILLGGRIRLDKVSEVSRAFTNNSGELADKQVEASVIFLSSSSRCLEVVRSREVARKCIKKGQIFQLTSSLTLWKQSKACQKLFHLTEQTLAGLAKELSQSQAHQPQLVVVVVAKVSRLLGKVLL